MYVCMCVCMYIYMYVCIHVCMYVCVYVCMYVYMYVCMYYISMHPKPPDAYKVYTCLAYKHTSCDLCSRMV